MGDRETIAKALHEARTASRQCMLQIDRWRECRPCNRNADVVVAALDLAGREAAAVERGRREAATEAYWALREHAAAYLRAKPVQKAREEVDLAGKNTPRYAHHRGFADGYRAAAAHVAGLHGLTVDELEDERAQREAAAERGQDGEGT